MWATATMLAPRLTLVCPSACASWSVPPGPNATGLHGHARQAGAAPAVVPVGADAICVSQVMHWWAASITCAVLECHTRSGLPLQQCGPPALQMPMHDAELWQVDEVERAQATCCCTCSNHACAAALAATMPALSWSCCTCWPGTAGDAWPAAAWQAPPGAGAQPCCGTLPGGPARAGARRSAPWPPLLPAHPPWEPACQPVVSADQPLIRQPHVQRRCRQLNVHPAREHSAQHQ